jgi:hypothetical protein
MSINNFDNQDKDSAASNDDKNPQLDQPVHPAQVMELARRKNMPLSVAAELADMPNLIRQLNEASVLAQEGDEEAQIVLERLIVEFRARAQNYDDYLKSTQG